MNNLKEVDLILLQSSFLSLWHSVYDIHFAEEYAEAIVSKGIKGINFLINHSPVSNIVQLRGTIFALGNQNEVDVSDFLYKYLYDSNPLLISETIDALSKLNNTDKTNVIKSYLQNHPNEYVKGSVLRYLYKIGDKDIFNILSTSLFNTNAIVRENAADLLDELGEDKAIPILLQALKLENNSDAKQAIKTALQNIIYLM
ncbi:MAG: HEAT repeat domain-containing protein [Saprospiraceae bacterium]